MDHPLRVFVIITRDAHRRISFIVPETKTDDIIDSRRNSVHDTSGWIFMCTTADRYVLIATRAKHAKPVSRRHT